MCTALVFEWPPGFPSFLSMPKPQLGLPWCCNLSVLIWAHACNQHLVDICKCQQDFIMSLGCPFLRESNNSNNLKIPWYTCDLNCSFKFSIHKTKFSEWEKKIGVKKQTNKQINKQKQSKIKNKPPPQKKNKQTNKQTLHQDILKLSVLIWKTNSKISELNHCGQ